MKIIVGVGMLMVIAIALYSARPVVVPEPQLAPTHHTETPVVSAEKNIVVLTATNFNIEE